MRATRLGAWAAKPARLGAYAALLALALGAAYALKRYYSGASARDLAWVLSPTAWLVEAWTEAELSFERGVGYVDAARLFAIVPACAGLNFLVVAFLSGALGLMRPERAPAANALLFAGSAIAAYVASLATNALRVGLAYRTHTRGFELFELGAGALHRIQGTAIYALSLCALYAVAIRLVDGGRRASS